MEKLKRKKGSSQWQRWLAELPFLGTSFHVQMEASPEVCVERLQRFAQASSNNYAKERYIWVDERESAGATSGYEFHFGRQRRYKGEYGEIAYIRGRIQPDEYLTTTSVSGIACAHPLAMAMMVIGLIFIVALLLTDGILTGILGMLTLLIPGGGFLHSQIKTRNETLQTFLTCIENQGSS